MGLLDRLHEQFERYRHKWLAFNLSEYRFLNHHLLSPCNYVIKGGHIDDYAEENNLRIKTVEKYINDAIELLKLPANYALYTKYVTHEHCFSEECAIALSGFDGKKSSVPISAYVMPVSLYVKLINGLMPDRADDFTISKDEISAMRQVQPLSNELLTTQKQFVHIHFYLDPDALIQAKQVLIAE